MNELVPLAGATDRDRVISDNLTVITRTIGNAKPGEELRISARFLFVTEYPQTDVRRSFDGLVSFASKRGLKLILEG